MTAGSNEAAEFGPPPLVTVVIPCFNAEAWLGDAIRSVLDQSLARVEIIVVDDGSADASATIARSFGDAVTCLTIVNSGACVARNRGLALARGDHVLFLDADDYLEGPFLAELAGCASEGVDLVVGGHVIEEEDGQRHPPRVWRDVGDVGQLMERYLAEFLQTATFLWRRGFLLAHGGWDEALPIAQDTDLAIRMIAAGPAFRIVANPRGLVVWRSVGGDNRITTRMTDRKRAALLHVLDKNRPAIEAMAEGRVLLALAGRYYALARLAYACGDAKIGDAALASARALGLAGHPGGLLHRGAAVVLGLGLKTRIVATGYRRFSRRPKHLRPHPYNLG